jgi:hypothetical protein
MTENIFVKILFIIFIGVIIYVIYYFFNEQYVRENLKCNLNEYDIDDLVIIKRTPEYSKLIDGLIDDKSFIFSDKQINVLKNPQQIFNVSNNTNDQLNIKNISDNVYLNCKNQLKNNTFDISNGVNSNANNTENFDNIIDVSSKEYTDIKNMLKNDIKQLIGPNYFNTGVLKQNMPLIKNYLKNYYQDLYGNKIDANLSDYFTAYYTLINNNDNIGLPVNTLIGNSNFIIPEQYNYDSHFTNAYNIDWNRIINPIGYS